MIDNYIYKENEGCYSHKIECYDFYEELIYNIYLSDLSDNKIYFTLKWKDDKINMLHSSIKEINEIIDAYIKYNYGLDCYCLINHNKIMVSTGIIYLFKINLNIEVYNG